MRKVGLAVISGLVLFGALPALPQTGIFRLQPSSWRSIENKSPSSGSVSKTEASPSANPESALILYPYSLSFGAILLGKTSDAQKVTLRNNGTTPLKIANIAVTDGFAQTNNCPILPATMAVDGDCGIQVTFKPSALGSVSGTLTVSDDAPGNPHKVALTGAGTSGTPNVKLEPDSLDFSEEPLGGSSTSKGFTITNIGTEPLTLTDISVDGDFVVAPDSTCETLAGTLAPRAKCNVNVTFTPLESGKRSGAVIITDNAQDSPQKVTLSGVGKDLVFGE